MQRLKNGIKDLLDTFICCKSNQRSISQYNLTTEIEHSKDKPSEDIQYQSENETNDRFMRSPFQEKSSEEKSIWVDDKKAAALWDLCEINLFEEAKEIIDDPDYHLELNTLNNDGFNLLHQSIRMNNFEVFEMLLNYSERVNINCPCKDKKTALHLATIDCNIPIAKALVEAGALLNPVDEELNTALHYAIIQEISELVELFVLNGANMDIKNNKGLTPMELLRQKDIEIVSDPSEIFTMSDYEEVVVDISIPEGVCRPDKPVILTDFILVQLIGRGSFGEVFLVKNKYTGEMCAMKVLKKEKIFAQNLQKYVLAERNILSYIKHPFIVKLKFAFQDREKVFLILEYCPGGNLAACIKRFGKLDEGVAKIYICEILLAISELHRRGIIYRDLKPDNVVLDSNGHALLTDFGLSKEGILDNVSARSFCGSVAYLAPEMIRRQGHGKPVDWYLLGVIMYEMLTGRPPYFSKDKQKLLFDIENAKLKIPSSVSHVTKDLLKKLLKKDPLKRLGTLGDAEEIKSHEFFQSVDWAKVYNKELSPPIPPKSQIRMELMTQYHAQGDECFDPENKINGWTFVDDD